MVGTKVSSCEGARQFVAGWLLGMVECIESVEG